MGRTDSREDVWRVKSEDIMGTWTLDRIFFVQSAEMRSEDQQSQAGPDLCSVPDITESKSGEWRDSS